MVNRAGLAEVLETELGPKTALVGKAVALPVMLASEFVMVLTEAASAYIPRTRQMIAAMREAGIEVQVHPILRMRLETWSALRSCDIEFTLPEHLAQSYGKRIVGSREFARKWHCTVREQSRFLRKLGRMLSPCELVEYLGEEEHETWFKKLRQCMKANTDLLHVQERVDALRHTALNTRTREDEVQAEIKMLENQRGLLNLTAIRPLKRRLDALPEDAPAAERKRLRAGYERAAKHGKALLMALETKQTERRRLQERRKQIGRKMRAIERGGKATAARRTLHAVHRAAEKARLRLARNAILASEGLEQANFRPAAWWIPAIDPSGKWFDRIRRTARFRLEQLV